MYSFAQYCSIFNSTFPKKTTYLTRQTAYTCFYCVQQVKVMLNLSASTVKFVHNSLDSTGGNSSSVKLWMEICCVLVWTQQSRHLRSPWRVLSIRNSQNETNLMALTCQCLCHTWGFGAFKPPDGFPVGGCRFKCLLHLIKWWWLVRIYPMICGRKKSNRG